MAAKAKQFVFDLQLQLGLKFSSEANSGIHFFLNTVIIRHSTNKAIINALFNCHISKCLSRPSFVYYIWSQQIKFSVLCLTYCCCHLAWCLMLSKPFSLPTPNAHDNINPHNTLYYPKKLNWTFLGWLQKNIINVRETCQKNLVNYLKILQKLCWVGSMTTYDFKKKYYYISFPVFAGVFSLHECPYTFLSK